MKAARQALELDPDYACALSSLGYLKRTYEWDWTGAQEAIDKARLLEPNNSNVMGSAASLANSLGQSEKAIALFEKKVSLDPLSLPGLRALALSYSKVGRYKDAIELLERVLTINPDYPTARRDIGIVYLRKGDFDQALEELEQAPAASINDFYRANILFRAGRESEAQALFDQLINTSAVDYAMPKAAVYAASGNLDAAFEWLEVAYRQRDIGLAFILQNFWLKPLHEDPRFAEIIEKMGLLPYWEAMPSEYGGPEQ